MEIADLPDLALLKVFSFFGNGEKIRRLMLVCKRWHSLLQADLQQLCIYDRRPPYRLFWNVFCEKEVDDQFIVRTKKLNEKFAIKFGNLKRLFLFKVTSSRLFLSSLNEGSLDQLVELRVVGCFQNEGGLDYLAPKLQSKINLPSLKKLCSNYGPYPSELNTPNLESIAGPFDGEVDFPEKIKSILCTIFETKQIFSNLEHLVCRKISSIFRLKEMPKLKRVELLPREASDFEMIESLRMQRDRLQRGELLIWVSGFKENFTPDLIDCFWKRFYEDSQFDSPLDSFDHFDYNEPLSVFPWQVVLSTPHLTRKFPNLEGIPENFFNVFIHIHKLQIFGVQVDGENLIRFIKKAKNIECLDVSDNRFNENFFHELSRIQSIRTLFLNNVFPASAYDADYDIGFMFNLPNIWLITIQGGPAKLKISAQLFIEFLRTKLLTGTKGFFKISARNKYVSITTDHDEYTFNYEGHDNDQELKFDSLNELVSYAEKIALKKNTIFDLD